MLKQVQHDDLRLRRYTSGMTFRRAVLLLVIGIAIGLIVFHAR